jgi:hypothetical protein
MPVGRTHLALIRTGLAFLPLIIAFFGMFGVSWWSIFDGALGAGSLVMTAVGLVGYIRSTRTVKSLEGLIPVD